MDLLGAGGWRKIGNSWRDSSHLGYASALSYEETFGETWNRSWDPHQWNPSFLRTLRSGVGDSFSGDFQDQSGLDTSSLFPFLPFRLA